MVLTGKHTHTTMSGLSSAPFRYFSSATARDFGGPHFNLNVHGVPVGVEKPVSDDTGARAKRWIEGATFTRHINDGG